MIELEAGAINLREPPEELGRFRFAEWISTNFRIIRGVLVGGVSGSFTAQSGEIITVTKGIITGIEVP
jgi:hypothetical protein